MLGRAVLSLFGEFLLMGPRPKRRRRQGIGAPIRRTELGGSSRRRSQRLKYCFIKPLAA